MARQNGDTHQESYVPTTIKAAQLAQLKAKRDTTIIGSTVSGKKVEVDTGHDLHMQSLQDVDNFKEHSKSAGFSVSSKPNFKNPTGSISASVGRIDSKWKSVTHQAGIYAGEDGYTLNVGNGTTLEGAVIKSEAPKAKNTLTTKSLEMKDIQNEAEYTYSNNGIGYNYYGSKKKLEEMKTNDKKGYDKIYNNIGLVPNLGIGSKGKASSTTQSAISDGILTVDGKEIDTKTININTENTLHQLDKIFDKKKIEERQELARLFSKNAFEQLHNWQPTTKDGKIAKSIAHGIIGEVAARMAGNTPGSGFKATMTNEMLIEKIKKIADNDPVLAQWLSATVGGVVNKASGENVTVGVGVSSYATKWNENDKSAVEIWANKSFDVVNIGQAATAGALDFKSGVGAGSALNAGATFLEDSNLDKYSMRDARARVLEDLVAVPTSIGTGVYASELSGSPAVGVAVSHALDQGVNAYQDVHHPPKNAEERKADNIEFTDEVTQDGFGGVKD